MTPEEQEFLAIAARLRIQGNDIVIDCSNCKHLLVSQHPWCAQHHKAPVDHTCELFTLGQSEWRRSREYPLQVYTRDP